MTPCLCRNEHKGQDEGEEACLKHTQQVEADKIHCLGYLAAGFLQLFALIQTDRCLGSNPAKIP